MDQKSSSRDRNAEATRAQVLSIKHRPERKCTTKSSYYIPQRADSRDLNRYLYTRVQSSIIPNSYNVEASQVSIDG